MIALVLFDRTRARPRQAGSGPALALRDRAPLDRAGRRRGAAGLRAWLRFRALAAAALPAPADLVLERTVRDRRTTPLGEVTVSARRERVWVSARRVLIEDLVFGRDLLVQLDRGLVVEIDRQARRVATCRLEDLAAGRDRLLAELAQVRARVAGTGQAAEIEALVAALQSPAGRDAAVRVREGADSAQMCGREVLPLALEQGGTRVASLWVAEGLAGGAALIEAYERLGWFPAGIGKPMLEAGRLPLRFEGRLIDRVDRVERVEVVTRIAEETSPPERYEVPAGFVSDGPPSPAPATLPEDPPGGREDGDSPAEKSGEAKAPTSDKTPEPKPERPDRGRR